jgi:hypothetical protein
MYPYIYAPQHHITTSHYSELQCTTVQHNAPQHTTTHHAQHTTPIERRLNTTSYLHPAQDETPTSLVKLFEAALANPNSVITLLGDTGSGKSHNLSHLLRQCSIPGEYAKLIRCARQLIEALTCAKTVESDISSRCVCYLPFVCCTNFFLVFSF